MSKAQWSFVTIRGLAAKVLKYLQRLGWALSGVVITALYLYYLQSQALPDLEYWHSEDIAEELVPELQHFANVDLAAYLAHEKKLFKRLDQAITECSADLSLWHRYNEQFYAAHRKTWPMGNMSSLRTPEVRRGAALLVHGLSDSPYSMQTLSDSLLAADFQTLNLRMPGHGTMPGALQNVSWRHFRASYQLAVRALAKDLAPEEPLILVGYSNGAALAVDYALRSLAQDSELPQADLLLLVSPAVQAPSVAAYARIQRWVSELPGMEKLGWTEVLAEYDPFKYNSFPVYAAEQIHQLTSRLQKNLRQLSAAQREQFPALIAFQSVVDATIPPRSIVQGLLDHLGNTPAELVLFDINRGSAMLPLLRTTELRLQEELQARPVLNFELTVVGNDSDDPSRVSIRRKAAGSSQWQESPTEMQWPKNTFSLSHVALPFSAEDPIYGPANKDGLMSLGELWFKGEHGVLGLPLRLLARQRYNPFFPYMERRIIEAAESVRTEKSKAAAN